MLFIAFVDFWTHEDNDSWTCLSQSSHLEVQVVVFFYGVGFEMR